MLTTCNLKKKVDEHFDFLFVYFLLLILFSLVFQFASRFTGLILNTFIYLEQLCALPAACGDCKEYGICSVLLVNSSCNTASVLV